MALGWAGKSAPAPAPVFFHVDMDDLWAVAECYGVALPTQPSAEATAALRHHIHRAAMPAFLQMFDELGVRATFFVCGRDLEDPAATRGLQRALDAGHRIANHSFDHPLSFRALERAELEHQIAATERAARGRLGIELRGFRAPGYGHSPLLEQVLAARGYAYDSSLMPSWWGGVLRLMDARLRRQARRAGGAQGSGRVENKTQFPRFVDGWASLQPYPVRRPSTGGGAVGGALPAAPMRPLLQLPVAASPLARLPFQAGVCLRLGPRYFAAHRRAWAARKHRQTPVIYLMHGTDIARLSGLGVPFFNELPYFNEPTEARIEKLSAHIKALSAMRPGCAQATTEEWLGV